MSSLFGLLSTGVTGMHAQSFGMQVTSQNAQNAGTEGYSRRDVRLSPQQGPPEGGGGVTVRGSRRIIDSFLEQRLLGATAAEGEATARHNALGILDRVLAEVDGGLNSALDDFEVALSGLTGTPADTAARQGVLGAAERLTAAFVDAGRTIDNAKADIDGQIGAQVNSINESLKMVAQLGTQINKVEVGGVEASDLRDQRDQLLRELSSQLPIKVIAEDNGGVNVLLGGSLGLVSADGRVTELSAEPDATTGELRLLRNTAGAPQDVTGLADSGAVGGLFAARDGAIADAESALDQLAFDLAGAYNGVHSAGVGMDGVAGRNLFTTSATAEGAAAAFEVSADVDGAPERLAAAIDPAVAAGDNRNSLALAALADGRIALGGTVTAQGALGAMIGSAGHAIQTASLDAEFRHDAMGQLGAMRDSVSGVNIDEEMIALSRYQRGYQASMRVVETADRLLRELVNLGR